MKTQTARLNWIANSVCVSSLASSLAVANDTEIPLSKLLGVRPKPSLIFINDSSGIVRAGQFTQLDYSASRPYPIPAKNAGDKSISSWTGVDILPPCTAANTRKITKTASACDFGNRQISGIGIPEQALSFAAPAVAVYSFNRTQHLSDLYMTTFVDSEQGRSTASVRKYRLQGGVIVDGDDDPATLPCKLMGESLQSQPAAVMYGGTPASPDVVIFAATNDGYVHAIDGDTGMELWAYALRELPPKLPKPFLNTRSAFKHRCVGGDVVPVVADRDQDGRIEPADGDFVHVVFGMRRGGRFVYSLDVTDSSSPRLNWRIAASSFGQSWSRPTIARIDTDQSNFSPANSDKAVVIVGGGYDPVHDALAHPTMPDAVGAGVYMLDLHTGNIIWRAGPDPAAQLTLDPGIRPGLSRSIPNQVSVVDLNGDGYADRMYASDTCGQILRFDIFPGRDPDGIATDAMVAGGVIAQLGAEGKDSPGDLDTRRFYTAPDVSVFKDNIRNSRHVAISIGSGYRPHPLDNTPVERFFSIRDSAVFTRLTQSQYDGYPIVTDADLVEVGGTAGRVIGQDQRGWMLTLPRDQKVLSSSVTFNNEIFFVALATDTVAAATCSAGLGRNLLYRVSVVNGDPVVGNLDKNVSTIADQLRMRELRQGGIAPRPRFLFPAKEGSDCTGEECTPPPVVCIGVECLDPGFANHPVRTLWTDVGVE
jgi:type IV pilus assembly protein PilY1